MTKPRSGNVKDIGPCKFSDQDPRNDAEIIHEMKRMGSVKGFNPKDFVTSAIELRPPEPEETEGGGFRKGDIVRLIRQEQPFSHMLPQTGIVEGVLHKGKFLKIQGRVYPSKIYGKAELLLSASDFMSEYGDALMAATEQMPQFKGLYDHIGQLAEKETA